MVCIFPECLVASLRTRPCLWVSPSLSWRDSFAHSDKRHMLSLNRCVCCCSRPWGSIMWSAQQIWRKRLSSEWIPWFHSPHSHLPSLPPSLRLLPGQLLGLWIIPLVRAGAVGSCCRAEDAGGPRAGSPLLLTMASLTSACKTAWAFFAQVACSHPPFLGVIGDSWKAVRPPRSDWLGSARRGAPRSSSCHVLGGAVVPRRLGHWCDWLGATESDFSSGESCLAAAEPGCVALS